ncbi:MAG: hypothetical protein ACRD1N_08275, partial [Terriglobia bacterium]
MLGAMAPPAALPSRLAESLLKWRSGDFTSPLNQYPQWRHKAAATRFPATCYVIVSARRDSEFVIQSLTYN